MRRHQVGLVFVSALCGLLACSSDDEPGDVAADGSGGTPPTSPDAGASTADASPPTNPYPDPGAFPANAGPGGPAVAFAEADLFENCAYLTGGDLDVTQHHNLVQMYDGYLLMPWAPQGGGGGLTFFDFSDPCDPVTVGSGYSEKMRESHSIGFSEVEGTRWAVVDEIGAQDVRGAGGIQFWDITDPSRPEAVAELEFADFFYPDAYVNVTLSVFWQGNYVYVSGGQNGVYIVDASDPHAARLVNQIDLAMAVGQVQAIGNLLVVTAAQVGESELLDISDPENPQPIAGGRIDIRAAYFSNVAGGKLYFTDNLDVLGGGGLSIYDIDDPSQPTLLHEHVVRDRRGAYVFIKDDLAFTGQGIEGVIFDVSDPSNVTEHGIVNLTGDLDTVTPIGNVAVVSVDDGAADGPPGEGPFGTSVAPYTTEVDTKPPSVTWSYPKDGAENVPLTSRIGITLSEFVDVKSAWTGSVRLYESGTDPAVTRVDGIVNAQEVIVNFSPLDPLEPGTTYTLEVPAGGLRDFNDNAIEEPFTMSFTTSG